MASQLGQARPRRHTLYPQTAVGAMFRVLLAILAAQITGVAAQVHRYNPTTHCGDTGEVRFTTHHDAGEST